LRLFSFCAFIPAMSDHTTTAAPTPPPDPPTDRAGTAVPNAQRLLGILRWIIDYGARLIVAANASPGTPQARRYILCYRSRDLALILTRIRRGLLLAYGLRAQLEARVERRRDVWPVPPPAPPYNQRRSTSHKAAPAPRRTTIIDLPMDRLPTEAEIAEELRRRPIGAVLVDICRLIGIAPGDLPGQCWDELAGAIVQYGGRIAHLKKAPGCWPLVYARELLAGFDLAALDIRDIVMMPVLAFPIGPPPDTPAPLVV
jgi:hypothetical protein